MQTESRQFYYIPIRGGDLIPFGTDTAAMIGRVRPDIIVDFTRSHPTAHLPPSPVLDNAHVTTKVLVLLASASSSLTFL